MADIVDVGGTQKYATAWQLPAEGLDARGLGEVSLRERERMLEQEPIAAIELAAASSPNEECETGDWRDLARNRNDQWVLRRHPACLPSLWLSFLFHALHPLRADSL